MKKIINTPFAPKAIGPYNQAVVFNNMVFTAGQIPINPETGELVEPDIIKQTQRCLENLKAVFDEAKCPLENTIKTTIYLTDLSHFSDVNKVYETYFPALTAPARACIEVTALPKGSLIEIDAIGYINKE